MRDTRHSLLHRLEQEAREARRQALILRRKVHGQSVVVAPGEVGSVNPFEAALTASAGQHDEILQERLAAKLQDLVEVQARIREGAYGQCRNCGCRIPRRRMEAVPTATQCVSCQARREAVHAPPEA